MPPKNLVAISEVMNRMSIDSEGRGIEFTLTVICLAKIVCVRS